jgi:hypothetical protein
MRLRLTTGDGVQVEFAVIPDAVPLLTQAVGEFGWTGPIIHSRRSGEEVFAALPGSFESALAICARGSETAMIGDVIAAAFPKYYRDAPPARILPFDSPYLHLGVIYGAAFKWATPAGTEPVAVIGHIESSGELLRSAGDRIRLTGSEQWTLHLEGMANE